jgi:hypothetical protein
MLSAVPSSGTVNSVIRITGIGDRDRPEWLIRISGIRKEDDRWAAGERRLTSLWDRSMCREDNRSRWRVDLPIAVSCGDYSGRAVRDLFQAVGCMPLNLRAQQAAVAAWYRCFPGGWEMAGFDCVVRGDLLKANCFEFSLYHLDVIVFGSQQSCRITRKKPTDLGQPPG